MRAMLVAAGFGTRLDPLTRELPKPALPVANRPIAWFACDHLARSGVREIVANTHHLAAELRAALEPHCPERVQLSFVHEPAILGTGGGVRNAWRPQPGEDLVVMNAKLLFAPDLGRALAAHRASSAIATMVLRPLPRGSSFTPIQVDAGGFVVGIGGKPEQRGPGGGATELMFTGVQILSARAWRDLPSDGDIIALSYRPWLARGERVLGVVDASPWMDIGVTVAQYLEGNLALARGDLRWPGITPAPGGVFVAPEAAIADDTRIELACIGPHASVAPGARIRRAVLWPSAQVSGSIEDAIVTTAGSIVRV